MHIAILINSLPVKRQVDTSEEIITAFFEMAIHGQKVAAVYAEDGSPGEVNGDGTLIIRDAAHLFSIMQEVRECVPHIAKGASLRSLPAWPKGDWFGPAAGSRLLSYDETHLLIGTGIGNLQLIERAEIVKMARTFAQ